MNSFLQELGDDLSYVYSSFDKLICVGDLNIDFLKPENYYYARIADIFESLSLKQFVETPTRITATSSTLLDVVILPENTVVHKIENIDASNISDHDAVVCYLKRKTAIGNGKTITFRDFKNFNYDAFYKFLKRLPFSSVYSAGSIDEKIRLLINFICDAFDIFAPQKTIIVKTQSAPWLSYGTKKLMNLQDKALQNYKRQKQPAKWRYYQTLRNLSAKTIKAEKIAYFKYLFYGNDKRQMWQNLKRNGIIKTKSMNIPEPLSNPNSFIDYLQSIVPKNSSHLNEISKFYSPKVHNENCFAFTEINENDIMASLTTIVSKAVGCDNIDIRMLTFCTPLIIPLLSHIINSCIETSYFPNDWKIAKIISIPKNTEPTNLSELRPISILPTMSKLFERILFDQIYKFVNQNNILPHIQSGFRKGFSCTTALLKVIDDVRRAQDKGMDTALVALDFTKAFDTLDPKILLIALEYWGFSKSALRLMGSYLNNRFQYVNINEQISEMRNVSTGVPQGSILGPLLFIIYTSKLYSVIEQCKVHMYADDVQIYYSSHMQSIKQANAVINTDIKNFLYWAKLHGLVINASKTQLIVFSGSKSSKVLGSAFRIYINDNMLEPTSCIKNLGMYMDSNLQFRKHINTLLRRAYFSLKQVYGSRHYLHTSTKKEICRSKWRYHIWNLYNIH